LQLPCTKMAITVSETVHHIGHFGASNKSGLTIWK